MSTNNRRKKKRKTRLSVIIDAEADKKVIDQKGIKLQSTRVRLMREKKRIIKKQHSSLDERVRDILRIHYQLKENKEDINRTYRQYHYESGSMSVVKQDALSIYETLPELHGISNEYDMFIEIDKLLVLEPYGTFARRFSYALSTFGGDDKALVKFMVEENKKQFKKYYQTHKIKV